MHTIVTITSKVQLLVLTNVKKNHASYTTQEIYESNTLRKMIPFSLKVYSVIKLVRKIHNGNITAFL